MLVRAKLLPARLPGVQCWRLDAFVVRGAVYTSIREGSMGVRCRIA